MKFISFGKCVFALDRTWNITHSDDDYSYFIKFIDSMANLTLDNFDTLIDYANDERIANINLRELVEFVNARIFIIDFAAPFSSKHKSTWLQQVYPSENFTVHSFNADVKYNVQQLITERGLCVTINAPLSKFLSERYFSASRHLARQCSVEQYFFFPLRHEKLRQEDIEEPMSCDFQQISQCFVRVEIYSVATVSCSTKFFNDSIQFSCTRNADRTSFA